MRLSVLIDTSMVCPVCGSATTIRSSRQVSNLLREEFIDCTNDLCPGRFKVNREIVGSLIKGSYEHGLNIPECLKRQALSLPRQMAPDPNQLELPGITVDPSAADPPP